jgi:serine/threonine protein kinase
MSREVLVRSENDATAEEASTAWTQKFGAPHVKLKRGLPDPLDVGKRLGSGGVGEVWATTIGGVPVALKRIYATHLTEAIFAEVKIMRQIAEKRHRHIVQLIGSYEKRHTNISELGLLIWPVAICDLAALLHDIDIARNWYVYRSEIVVKTNHDEEDVIYAIEALARFESGMVSPGIIKETTAFLDLYENTRNRLQKSIGCIASAVAWLHDCQIRHKDLKPSQILVSTSGLWLSDFGWSKDVSEMTCSTTVGGKTTTPKYLAPERASNQPCGRPEDIFSLGCIFLEIGYQLFGKISVFRENQGAPWFQPGWLFSTHVEDAVSLAQDVMHHIEPGGPLEPHVSLLMPLVVRMLDQNPARRPLIAEVVAALARQPKFSGYCCRSTKPQSLDTDTKAPIDSVMSAPSDHHLNPSDHWTNSPNVGISLFNNGTHQFDNFFDSFFENEETIQEYSWESATGQKRPLSQASPYFLSELPPRKRMVLNSYPSNLPSLVPPVHATSSESTQPVDHHKDVPEKYRVSTDRSTHLPQPTAEGTQLSSINELPCLQGGKPTFVSPNIAYTLTPVEVRTESPHRMSGHLPSIGPGSLSEHWEPHPPDILPDNSGATTTEASVQLSPDSLCLNSGQLPHFSLSQSSVQYMTQCPVELPPTSPLWGEPSPWPYPKFLEPSTWVYPGNISNPIASLHDKAEHQWIENQGPDASTPIASKSRSPSKNKPQSAPSAFARDRLWKEPEQVSHACVYCRRSHMTCDGEKPCARCIKRNIEHLCHYESPIGMKKSQI